ncbi:MAG: hypothetical protein P8M63_14855 [Paracoccaceae bacterium]|nr:hypothetical protein [Paracoccaceae bacterium]
MIPQYKSRLKLCMQRIRLARTEPDVGNHPVTRAGRLIIRAPQIGHLGTHTMFR